MKLTDCSYCWRPYSLSRKPLILKCGHSFCQDCIEFIFSQGFYFCPKDKKPNQSEISSLPVHRNLFGQITNKYKICPTHLLNLKHFHIKSAKFLCDSCLKLYKCLETEIKQFASIEEFLDSEYKTLCTKVITLATLYKKNLDYMKIAKMSNKYLERSSKYDSFKNQPLESQDLESQILTIKKYDLLNYNEQHLEIETRWMDSYYEVLNLYVSDMQDALIQNNYNQLNLWTSKILTIIEFSNLQSQKEFFSIKSKEEIWLEAIALGTSLNYGMFIESIYLYDSDSNFLFNLHETACFYEKQPGSIAIEIPIEPCIRLKSDENYTLLITGNFSKINYGTEICQSSDENQNRFQVKIISKKDENHFSFSRIFYFKIRLK